MKRYRVTQTYKSADTSYVEGQILELDDDTAAWMLRDVPGCIVPEGSTASQRVVTEPQSNRMEQGTSKRGRD